MPDSDYGDIDESACVSLAEFLEHAKAFDRVSANKKTPGVVPGAVVPVGGASSTVGVENMPEWAVLAEPLSPDTSDYESTSGVGNSRKEKAQRARRMRRQGRPQTPDWIEVPKDKRYLFSKFSDFGQGSLTLMEWMLPRPNSVQAEKKRPVTPVKAGVSQLCGDPRCSGQHPLSECPYQLVSQSDDGSFVHVPRAGKPGLLPRLDLLR